jgi:hypothetical protein
MKGKQLIICLVLINLSVLFYLVSTSSTKAERLQSVAPIIRARAIELVDANGQSRALLNIETNGETVFRLRDAKGTIRVKLGASEGGSGLLLLDDATNPGLHALAKKSGTTVTLFNKTGRKHVIEP